jgi:hypothetical protein
VQREVDVSLALGRGEFGALLGHEGANQRIVS